MTEQSLFVAAPFSLTESNGETYLLLPFSGVSTIVDGNLQVLDVASSSDQVVQNIIIDNQSMPMMDGVHLISTNGVPVVNIQNLSLPMGSEINGTTTFALPNNICLLNAMTSDVPQMAAFEDDQDCLYLPNCPEEQDENEIGEENRNSLEQQLAIGETSRMLQVCDTCGYQTDNVQLFSEHRDSWNRARHYRCDVCETIFDQIEKLTVHEKQCRTSKQYRCDCGEMFNREVNYTIHAATHNLSAKELQCPLCQKTFRRAASFRCHLKLHAVDDVVSCLECSEEFNTNEELRHHSRTMHPAVKPTAPVNICKQCGAVFKRPLELAEHLITHKKIKETLRTSYRRKKGATTKSDTGRYTCSVCSKKFEKKTALDRHQLIHTGERPFVCKVCGKSFNQKGSLMFHEAKHLPQKPHKCLLCGAGFSQRGNLRTHVKRVHPATVSASEKMLECQLCSCSFKSAQSLQAHLSKRHHEQFMDRGAGRRNKSGRSKDALSHAPQTPSIHCTTAINVTQQAKRNGENLSSTSGNIFTVNATKEKNQNSNSSVILFPTSADGESGARTKHWCTDCGKRFSKLSDLTRHIRTHTGERPFACELCPQRFAVLSTLEKHVRSRHLHLKSARCYICWKELSNNFTLANHLLIHRRETIDCDKCTRKFRTVSDLRRHSKRVHSNLDSTTRNWRSKEKEKENSKTKLQEPLMETETGLVQLVEKGGVNDTRILPLLDESGNLIRPYACQICSMRFKKRSHLDEHSRTHDASRSYICQFGNCRKTFVNVSALRDHAKIHSGVKKHFCLSCKKSFLTKRSLNRHMFVHSDPTVRPFICPYCGKRFKRGVLCRRHIKIHKSDPRFEENANVVLESNPNFGDWTSAAAENEQRIHIANAYSVNESTLAPRTNWTSQESGTNFLNCVDASNANVARVEADLTSGDGFLAGNRSPMSSFVACWDASGQTSVPTVSVYVPSQNLLANPESILRTPDAVGGSNLNNGTSLETPAPMFLDHHSTTTTTALFFCGLCHQSFADELQLDLHVRSVHHHSYQNLDYAGETVRRAVEAPIFQNQTTAYDERSGYGVLPNWQRRGRRTTYSCPECGQGFFKAVHLTRHVYDAHPNTNPLMVATPGPNNWNGVTNQLPQEQVFVSSIPDQVYENPTTIIQDEHQQAVLNMTGQIPITQINNNNGDHGWGTTTNRTVANFPSSSITTQDIDQGELPIVCSGSAKVRVCPCCGKAFKKPSDLIRHIRIHTDERPFACECGRAFRVKSGLISHKQTHETNRAPMHRCQVCNKTLASRGALKSHLRQHTNEKSFRCPQCDDHFRSSAQLQYHLTSDHESAAAASSVQQQNYQPTTTTLLCSGEPSAFTQVMPPANLSDTDRLALNMVSNVNNEWQVDVRRLSAATIDDDQSAGVVLEVGFLRDMVTQGLTLSIPFSVDGAPETSVTVDPSALLEHGQRAMAQSIDNNQSIIDHHSTTRNRNAEPATPSAYLMFPSGGLQDQSIFGEYVATTTTMATTEKSESSFIVECKICDLKFSNVQESRIHFQSPDHETAMCVQRETNGPTHMCDVCGKMFVTRIRLERHMRSHTGERPFQCNVCGECFTQSNSLKKHYLSKHTELRPYACPICDRRFALKYNMETHVRRAHGQIGANENVVAVEPENSRQRVRTYLLSL